MKRKEEIEQAARDNESGDYRSPYTNFVQGANWADENPDEHVIAKYLYEKKGYPVDINGNLPSFEETMKDCEKYWKYEKKQLINKVCEHLKKLTYQEYPGGPFERSIDDYQIDKLIELISQPPTN